MEKVINGIRGAVEQFYKENRGKFENTGLFDEFLKEGMRPGKDHGPIVKKEENLDGWVYLEFEDGHWMQIGKEELEYIMTPSSQGQQ